MPDSPAENGNNNSNPPTTPLDHAPPTLGPPGDIQPIPLTSHPMPDTPLSSLLDESELNPSMQASPMEPQDFTKLYSHPAAAAPPPPNNYDPLDPLNARVDEFSPPPSYHDPTVNLKAEGMPSPNMAVPSPNMSPDKMVMMAANNHLQQHPSLPHFNHVEPLPPHLGPMQPQQPHPDFDGFNCNSEPRYISL